MTRHMPKLRVKIEFAFNSSNHKRYTKNVTSYSFITIVYGSVSMDYKIDIYIQHFIPIRSSS